MNGLTVAIIGAPWLAMLPVGGVLAIVVHALAFVAAFHGWGLVVAQRARVSAFLAIQWGIAAVIAIAGLAIALHRYTEVVQIAVVFGGVAIHSATLAIRFRATSATLTRLLADARWWLVPVGAIVVIGLLYVVGSAGDVTARPFDDDGHVLGQLRGLADTGALADPIGAPRIAQLGGQLGILAIVSVVGDLHFAHMIDALACLLVLGLACARIEPRTGRRAIWIAVLIVVVIAMPIAIDDLAPTWLAVGLIVALFVSIADGAPARAVGLVAGALIALRLEFAPLAVVAIALAGRHDRKRALAIVATAALVVVPFAIARAMAWASVADGVRHLAVPSRGGLVAHVAIALGVTAIATPILLVVVRGTVALASAASLGAIVGGVFGPLAFGGRLAWPIAIAVFVVLVIDLARQGRTRSIVPFVVLIVACSIVQAGQTATGRMRWTRRELDLAGAAGYIGATHAWSPASAMYAAAFAAIPEGATVALWVRQPEAVDHAHHRILDLRTPRVPRARLAALLDALHPAYFVVEDEPGFASPGVQVIQVSP